MGARSRASKTKTMSSWAGNRPDGSEPESRKKARADAVFTDLTRAAIFFGIVALVVRVGEDLSVARLATPIIAVAGVVLVLLAIAELRAYRRWTLH
jgi:Flp pilus assembly protein TadB